MIKNIQYWISGLLILSSGLLTSLVPGGLIETRDFSHINPIILAAFNAFLTSLAIGSLLLVYFIFRKDKRSFIASVICGVAYFLVYVLDLAVIFPVSSDPMPLALFIIEIVGTIVSLPLIFLALKQVFQINKNSHYAIAEKKSYSRTFLYLSFLSIFLGCGIITFATISAMGIG